MIVTEEEAKTKRCQESFGSHGAFTDAVPELGREIVTATRNCLGSACMAWRIGKAAVPAYPGDAHSRMVSTDGGRSGHPETFYLVGTDRPAEPEKGFCGKAGKP